MFNASLQSLSFNLTSGGCGSERESKGSRKTHKRAAQRCSYSSPSLHLLNMRESCSTPRLLLCNIPEAKPSHWMNLNSRVVRVDCVTLWSTLLPACHGWMLKQGKVMLCFVRRLHSLHTSGLSGHFIRDTCWAATWVNRMPMTLSIKECRELFFVFFNHQELSSVLMAAGPHKLAAGSPCSFQKFLKLRLQTAWPRVFFFS